MSYLGIDVGEKRTGVSATDALGIAIQPLVVIPTNKAVEEIIKIIIERSIKTIVIGMPYNSQGEEGFAAEKVKKFRMQLEQQILKLKLKIDIVFWDEGYTTKKAQKWLHESGMNTKKSKGVVDKLAAVALLEDYLSHIA